jgi:hypothetical protein
MAKSKKRYGVDIFDQGYPNEWAYFPTLRKAVRFANKHGLTADRILDRKTGDTIEGLDLRDTRWISHRELEAELTRAKEHAVRAEARHHEERAKRLNAQYAFINAGLIPIEVLTERLTDMTIESGGLGHGMATLRIATNNPLNLDTPYNRQPIIVALEAIRKGMK